MEIFILKCSDKYTEYKFKSFINSEYKNIDIKERKYFLKNTHDNSLGFKKNSWSIPLLEKSNRGIKGDCHFLKNSLINIFSKNFVNKLGDILEEQGVLFPIKVEDRDDYFYRYWVINELNEKAVDINCSLGEMKKVFEESISNRKLYDIATNTPCIRKEYLENISIFRLKGSNLMYVTETIVNYIDKYKLKGFLFTKVGNTV